MIRRELLLKITRHIFQILLGLFLLTNTLFAQVSDWIVTASDFQYTMTFVGFLNMDGKPLSSPDDKLAAFVNGECRGVANLIYVANQKGYYAYLTVFSNVNSEIIHFKIYNAAQNTIKDIGLTKPFAINQHFGNLFQAISFANPALSASAEILDFNFKDVVRKTIELNGSKVVVGLDKQQPTNGLNAIFTLSKGATAFIGTSQQLSGANSIDFTKSVLLTVLSEDQSVLKEWTVMIQPPLTYYRKNAVCYAKGEIKVLYPTDGEGVDLEFNGQRLTSQVIASGQTIFTNLVPGIYKVKAAGVVKEITVLQK
jgi:hypothetical protein